VTPPTAPSHTGESRLPDLPQINSFFVPQTHKPGKQWSRNDRTRTPPGQTFLLVAKTKPHRRCRQVAASAAPPTQDGPVTTTGKKCRLLDL